MKDASSVSMADSVPARKATSCERTTRSWEMGPLITVALIVVQVAQLPEVTSCSWRHRSVARAMR